MVQSKPHSKPHPALFKLIDASCVIDPSMGVDRYDLAAICLKESFAVPVFCTCNKNDMANLQSLVVGAGVDGNEFLKYITIDHGTLKGNKPRFQFVPAHYTMIQATSKYGKLRRVEQAFLACKVGIAQKSLYQLSQQTQDPDFLTYCKIFAGDTGMQIRQLLRDLSVCVRHAGGKKDLGFSFYGYGSTFPDVRPYGVEIVRTAASLREQEALHKRASGE